MGNSIQAETFANNRELLVLPEKARHYLFGSLESIAKLVVLSIGALYALGLIVTNQYLLSIEGTDFTSLQPKCVVTGAWSLALVVVSALPALMFFLSFSFAERFSHKKRVLQLSIRSALVCAGLGLGTALAYFGVNFVISLLRVPADPVLVPLKLALCWDVFVWSGLLGALWGFVRLLPAGAFKVALIVYVALCLCGAAKTSQDLGYIYGEVPQAMGGGLPVRAKLVFNENGLAFWRAIGGQVSSVETGSKQSVEVDVLFQDEHYFVIRLLGQEVLSVKELGAVGNVPGLTLPTLGDTTERNIVLSKLLVDGLITHRETLIKAHGM